MQTAFVLSDDSVPRTQFYGHFLHAAIRNPRFADWYGDGGTVVFPAEECSPSLNWPTFGDANGVYLRGSFCLADMQKYALYTRRFLNFPAPRKCLMNMMPGSPLAPLVVGRDDIIIADINLLWEHRLANPNTISLPALPLNIGEPDQARPRDIFASFQGFRSHPVRDRLEALHDGSEVICRLLEREHYLGQMDALAKVSHAGYEDLLRRSLFAFVPRGDAHFSIRLLEVMSFGCIPVILSDGWVLPFDHIVDWSDLCVQFAEAEVQWSVARLRRFSSGRIAAMQSAIRRAYTQTFASMDCLTEGLFREVEYLTGV